MPRSDKHNYARRQELAERAAANARRELDEHTILGTVPESTDWDAALVALTSRGDNVIGPAPSTLHKSTHGGYPGDAA